MSAVTPRFAGMTKTSEAPAIRRAVFNTVRGSLGNLVEWYDVYVYTVFATYLQASFFAEGEPNAGIYTPDEHDDPPGGVASTAVHRGSHQRLGAKSPVAPPDL